MTSPAPAPHRTGAFLGRTTPSTAPHPSEIAMWAITPEASSRRSDAPPGASRLPAARTVSRRSRPVQSACTVEGTPLGSDATAPATSPSTILAVPGRFTGTIMVP